MAALVIQVGRRLAAQARIDLLWVTRDMRTAVLWYLSDTLLNLSMAATVLLLSERFAGIGAWTRADVLFMLGYALVVSGVAETFFSFNVSMISRRIGRGQLDHLLIQPGSLLVALLTEGFVPFSGSGGLLVGAAALALAIPATHIHVDAIWVALLVASIASSSVIALSYLYMWGSLAFWAPRAAEETSSASWQLLQRLRMFPLDGAGAGLTATLLSVVPAGLLAWYPSGALLGIRHREWELAVTPLAAAASVALATLAFRRGMNHYANVGSQRYSGWGHRS